MVHTEPAETRVMTMNSPLRRVLVLVAALAAASTGADLMAVPMVATVMLLLGLIVMGWRPRRREH